MGFQTCMIAFLLQNTKMLVTKQFWTKLFYQLTFIEWTNKQKLKTKTEMNSMPSLLCIIKI